MQMLMWIAMVLLAVWLVGLVLNVVGPIIHILLVAAAVFFVISMFTGRRTTF
jgi:hypothetical protein